MSAERGARAVERLLLAGLGGLVAWLAWRSLRWPLIHDAPIMHYIAWRISEGAAPYRDLFDMNFPGVYLFHLAVVKLLGTGDGAWRAVDLGTTVVAALLVAALAAPWGRVASIGGGLVLAAYHLASGAWNAGQRDFLLCPFLLAAALGLARWSEGAGLSSVLLAGLALGAGMTIKPHALVFAAGLAVFIAVRGRLGRRSEPACGGTSRGVVSTLGAFAAGLAMPPLAAIAWVASFGALGAWRDIVFGYLLPLYSRVARPADWLYFRWQPWLAIIGMLAVSLASLAWRRGLTARHAVVLVGLAYGVVHFVGQRKGWEYHLYPLAAFAAVLVCAEIERSRGRRVAWLALAAGLASLVWSLGVKGVEAADSGWIAMKERRVTALTADLVARTKPGDEVQVLDTTDGGVHALLRARIAEPTRFVYDFHFFHHTESPTIQRLRSELVHDLRARPPALVVAWEPGWPVSGYERFESFPALTAWLRAEYTLAHEGDGYRIYAKRHDS